MTTCRTCHRPFDAEAERAALEVIAREAGWAAVALPSRCLECRRAARQAKYETPADATLEDEMLVCADCAQSFIFGGRDRAYFARQGWVRPKRCRWCRTARKQAEARRA